MENKDKYAPAEVSKILDEFYNGLQQYRIGIEGDRGIIPATSQEHLRASLEHLTHIPHNVRDGRLNRLMYDIKRNLN